MSQHDPNDLRAVAESALALAPGEPLLIATGNRHKAAELGAILDGAGLGVECLADLVARGMGPFPEPDETGATFADNARIKAIAYARATGRTVLADDSGLEVEALGGAPGVHSSHYGAMRGMRAGDPMPDRPADAVNNARLLDELAGLPDERRAARFVCQIVVARADGSIVCEPVGTFDGRIGVPPRVPSGSNGFGYDPLFLVGPEHARTSAELEAWEKNRLSHRARAGAALVGWIRGRSG